MTQPDKVQPTRRLQHVVSAVQLHPCVCSHSKQTLLFNRVAHALPTHCWQALDHAHSLQCSAAAGAEGWHEGRQIQPGGLHSRQVNRQLIAFFHSDNNCS
jgi:hypothetical protein